jgi:pimeloyl-ACP methyl ester carboxylesterase
MSAFFHEGHRIAYTERGRGPHAVVLVHGLLLSQKLVTPLAKALARRGNRVITVDMLGHGRSDRPTAMTNYSMTGFGEQVIALLDHLEIDRAVIGGVSLGANTSLEAAVLAPDRVQGLIVEMPVLDNALLGCAIAFTPLMVALTFGEPVMRGLAGLVRRIPAEPMPPLVDAVLDPIRQDPAPSAAVLQGLFFSRVAPPKRLRRTIEAPALVIGHRRDPIHPFSDSGALVDEMPNARLIEAKSILELRVAPKRLTDEIAGFLDEVWSGAASAPTSSPRVRVA